MRWSHLARLRRGAALGIVFAVGCTSFRSKLVDDNGCCPDLTSKHLKGLPMTLTVPTHVQLTLTRTQYASVPVDGTETTPLEYNGNLVTTYGVDHAFLDRKQLHTVDFKRPFSGSLMTKIGFDKDQQYITSFNNRVDDTTITDVTALITGVLTRVPALKALGKPTSSGPANNKVIQFTNVIAVELFDVHDPALAEKMQAFLDHHLNACNPPCAGPACR